MNRIFKNMRTAIFALCCTVVASCNDSVSVDAIYITAAEKTPVTSFSAKHAGDAMGITISSALIPSEDIEGTLSIDNALVENYNSSHGENFQALPDGICKLSENHLKIQSGMHRSEPVKLIVEDIESLKKGINYLVPIRLQSQSKTYPALPGSDVLYVVLNRTILMNVPKLNGENYFKVNFKDQDVSRFQNLDEFTLEARINMWQFPKYYDGNLMGILGFPESETIEKSAWLFVDGTPDRVGGAGNVPVVMLGVKQWSVYAGKLGFPMNLGEWYHVAGVFSNNKLQLYLDGILFAEADYSKKISFTNNFYIGAAPGVQNGFHFKGSISEARFWTRALTPAELRNPLHRCFVDVDSKGLEGYWKLDDMADNCKDYTGHGHTAVKEGYGSIEWQQEVPCP